MKTLKMLRFRWAIIYMMSALLLISGCEKEAGLNSDPNLNSDNTITVLDNTLSLSVDSLSDAEISSLMYMVEEVKMARDVYFYMLNLYGSKIFDHIMQSEIKHMNTISELITKYALENPTTDNAEGVFVNEELQILYNDLIILGSVSKADALNAGITIEEKEIQDVQSYLDLVAVSKDIVQVYTHLLNSSQTHLTSFIGKLE